MSDSRRTPSRHSSELRPTGQHRTPGSSSSPSTAWGKPETPLTTGKAKNSSSAKSPAARAITPETITQAVMKKHEAGTLSLVICNTVDMLRDVFRAMSVEHKVLLTLRFRREDRSRHEQRLLDFDANRKAGKLRSNDRGLVCVSTQEIEAAWTSPRIASAPGSALAVYRTTTPRKGHAHRIGLDDG